MHGVWRPSKRRALDGRLRLRAYCATSCFLARMVWDHHFQHQESQLLKMLEAKYKGSPVTYDAGGEISGKVNAPSLAKNTFMYIKYEELFFPHLLHITSTQLSPIASKALSSNASHNCCGTESSGTRSEFISSVDSVDSLETHLLHLLRSEFLGLFCSNDTNFRFS